jgi:long-chain acyl-CoA synthetase
MSKKNFGEFLRYQCKSFPNRNAISWIDKGKEVTQKFEAYYKDIESLALGLLAKGFSKGDRIALLADTSTDWNRMDYAALSIGGIVVPIYPTLVPEDINYIFNHSECSFIFLDTNKQLQKIKEQFSELKILKGVLVNFEVDEDLKQFFSDKAELLHIRDLSHDGHELVQSEPNKFNEIIESVGPSDIATIIYTSGTTGKPKGATMLHETLLQMFSNVQRGFSGSISERDKTLCFLPLSHVLGRTESMLNVMFGLQVAYSRGADLLLEDINITKPTLVIAVPRVFEKIYTKINLQIESMPILKRKMFDWAKDISDRYFEKIEADLAPPTAEILLRNTAYNAVYKKMYERFGGNIRFFVSGGAPLSPDIIRFLRNANLTVLEGYGLTETFGPIVINPVRKQIPGTVGLPLGEVKIKLDTDGEILIKSKSVFKEYYKNKEETSSAFSEDGWFRTGDIGEISTEGYLKITDRKKDIIITSAGKNIAPQHVENVVKSSPYISQFVVIGDQRKYLTGIVGLEKEDILELLDKHGIDRSASIEEISKNADIRNEIRSEIEKVNQRLAKYETIKDFFISPHNFSIDSGHLTPSLKIKRKRVLVEFADEVDAMYKDA